MCMWAKGIEELQCMLPVKNNLFLKDSNLQEVYEHKIMTPRKEIQMCFYSTRLSSAFKTTADLSSCNLTCSLSPSTPSKMAFFSSQWSALS